MPNHKVMTLKDQLQFYIRKSGMSASALARKASVPKQSLSGWMAGSMPRDIRQLKRVADALAIPLDHLVFGNGDHEQFKQTDSEAVLGDRWVSGIFEVKFRRLKKGE